MNDSFIDPKVDSRILELTCELKKSPSPELYSALGEALLQKGDMEGLSNMLGHRASSYGDGQDFFYNLLENFIASLDHAKRHLYQGILATYPDGSPSSAVVMMFRGFLNTLSLDLDQASETLRQASARLQLFSGPIFSASSNYEGRAERLARNAFLCEPSTWRPDVSQPVPEMVFLNDLPDHNASIACVTCAEPFYLRHYGETFLSRLTAALGTDAVALVGVVNPDPATRGEMDRLARAFPQACFFTVDLGGWPGETHAWASASMRFILGAPLLDRLARPTVFLSIDSDLSFPRLGDYLRAVVALPLSCQILKTSPQRAHKLLSPDLIVDPGLVSAHPGPVGQRFFEDVSSFLLGKLAFDESPSPLQNLDRVALFRAVCLAKMRDEAVADSTEVRVDTETVPVFARRPLHRLVDDWGRRLTISEPVQETIDIAFAADRGYLGYTAVALASLLKNYRGTRALRIFMLLDQPMPAEDLRRYQALSTLHPFSLQQIIVDTSDFQGCPSFSTHLTAATYNRLVMHPQLPADCHKILYLDSDLVVLDSIDDLFDTPFNGTFLSGTEDVNAAPRFYTNDLSDGGVYISAGVLLMNVDAIRSIDFAELIRCYLDRDGYRVTLVDQQIINELFCLRATLVPLEWNVLCYWFKTYWEGGAASALANLMIENEENAKKAASNPRIFHYCGSQKPWTGIRSPGSHRWYPYLDLTGYAADIQKPEGWSEVHHEPREPIRLTPDKKSILFYLRRIFSVKLKFLRPRG